MATIIPHTTRATGTILTAVIYNGDHQVHITNAESLNVEVLQNAADIADITGGAGTNPLSGSGLTVTSIDPGAGSAPIINLYRNSASPAAADGLGVINFSGEDSVGNAQTYAQIRAVLSDPTDTSEDGQIILAPIVAGVITTRLTLDSNGVTTTGAFTSTGIDDNAPGERLEVNDTSIVVGTTGAITFSIRKADALGGLALQGSNTIASGAAMILLGSSEAYDLRTNNTIRYSFAPNVHTFSGTVRGNSLQTLSVLESNPSATLTLRPNTGSIVGQTQILTSGDMTVSGAVSATQFNGSAAGLTSIGTPIAGQGVGTVGSYALCRSAATIVAGGTIAGASLTYTDVNGATSGGSPAGTWRAMGAAGGPGAQELTTMFLRIS